MRRQHVPLLLFILLTLPAASAQPPGPEPEVWDSPRTVEDFLILRNNTTLTIRGTTVALGAGFRVDAGSRLILESTPDAPAKLVSSDETGYVALVLGTLEVRGLPDQPVVIDGSGGQASANKEFLFVESAIDIAGTLTGQHFIVSNYTAGIRSDVIETRIDVRDVTFRSAAGVGLMLSSGIAEIANATFEGPGATLWSTTTSDAYVQNATFRDSATPIAVNGGFADLRNVSITSNVTRCLKMVSGDVEIRGFTCTGYSENGLQLTRSSIGIGDATVDVEGLRVYSDNESAGAAVNAIRVKSLALRNSTIGPLARNAIRLERTEAVFDGVWFENVGEFNVFLVDPPSPPPYERMGQGDPGGRGWLQASGTAGADLLLPDLKPPSGGTVVFVAASTGRATRAVVNDEGRSEGVLLEAFEIDGEGTPSAQTYTVQAMDPSGAFFRERADYAPTEGRLTIVLEELPAQKAVPLGPLVALGAIAIACLVARRR